MEPSVSENDMIGPHMSIREMFDLLLGHGCIDLASKMDSEQDTAMIVSGGGFGDIWMGKMHDGAKVAIKAWRASALEQYSYKTLKRATREIHVWSKMKHRNVHQLMGVIMFRGVYIGMVSEWMDNGNLYEYMRKHPDFDRYQMCVQITSGLAYMHQNDVVHGDLKSMNILMSLDGVPKLSDFGLSNMSGGSLAFSNTSSGQSGTTRWAAPEQLLIGASSSKRSDVYALAMTMLEIFTRRMPYPQCQREFQIIVLLQKGTLPERPKELPADDERGNEMWDLLVSCWNHEPGVRPSATAMLESVTGLLKSKEQGILELEASQENPDLSDERINHKDLSEECVRLLSDLYQLNREVYEGLILGFKIPSPMASSPLSSKEVFFPAKLISLISKDMWERGMIKESKGFLANTMQAIQMHVTSFTGEDKITPGVFWMSNVHEILSFVSHFEANMLQATSAAGKYAGYDFLEHKHLVHTIKSSLDSLEHNIYRSWMVDIKKRLSKMITPALFGLRPLRGRNMLESFGLVVFKSMGQLPRDADLAYNMDDVLDLLNKVIQNLKRYFMEQSMITQVMTDLLKLVNVTSFNKLLTKRDLCFRGRGKFAIQVHQNSMRIQEWCKKHDISKASLEVEHLIQATALLQSKKATQADIAITSDASWLLTPSQTQRILQNYSANLNEEPISPEILQIIGGRVKPNDPDDYLLLTPENEDTAPYELPPPREATGLNPDVPAGVDIPNMRRLAEIILDH